ncbi:MAG: hypothetical protein AAB460_01570 [Patescibacteria group bacterium]
MALALLSLTAMLHESDGGMSGDCPFSPMGATLCPQDSLAELAHHISAYRMFFNVPVGIGFTIIALLFALTVLLLVFIASPPLQQPVFVRSDHGAPPLDSYQRRIIDWLALFENSPSHA